MAIKYQIDVLKALKDKGYNTNRLRKEHILGESFIQQIRTGKIVSWQKIDLLCELLECQVGEILIHVPESDDEN